jgi:hypothetical protein
MRTLAALLCSASLCLLAPGGARAADVPTGTDVPLDPLAPDAWAAGLLDLCGEEGDARNRVVRRGTLVVERGADLRSAVAIEGDVLVREGATVRAAVAVRGRVIVEPGASVTGALVALDGEAHVDPAAHTEGVPRVLLGEELVVVDSRGQRARIPGVVSWLLERPLRRALSEALARCEAQAAGTAQETALR